MQVLGEPLTQAELNQMVLEADLNGNTLSYFSTANFNLCNIRPL